MPAKTSSPKFTWPHPGGLPTMRSSLTLEFNVKPQTQQQANHRTDTLNKNKGTPGTNPAYAKNQGNRGKQLNPTHKGR